MIGHAAPFQPALMGPQPDPVTVSDTPFVTEISTASFGDSKMAALAGVRSRVIVALRKGIPLWELQRDYKKVARAVGVAPQLLRARIAKAKREHMGRRDGLASAPASVFSGLH